MKSSLPKYPEGKARAGYMKHLRRKRRYLVSRYDSGHLEAFKTYLATGPEDHWPIFPDDLRRALGLDKDPELRALLSEDL